MARDRYLNDKYHVTLISINPRKERTDQYNWEKEKYETLHSQYQKKLHQRELLDRYKHEVAETEKRLNIQINELSSRYDFMDREDANTNAQNLSVDQSALLHKKEFIKQQERQANTWMDDIDLHNGVVPKYHEMENRDLAKEEEVKYE